MFVFRAFLNSNLFHGIYMWCRIIFFKIVPFLFLQTANVWIWCQVHSEGRGCLSLCELCSCKRTAIRAGWTPRGTNWPRLLFFPFYCFIQFHLVGHGPFPLKLSVLQGCTVQGTVCTDRHLQYYQLWSVFSSGACNQDDWISAVRPVIEKRIQKWIYFFHLCRINPKLMKSSVNVESYCY